MIKIWEMVKTIEEAQTEKPYELKEIIATLVVNYGPDGKCRRAVITGNEKPILMLRMVCEWYEGRIEALRGIGYRFRD